MAPIKDVQLVESQRRLEIEKDNLKRGGSIAKTQRNKKAPSARDQYQVSLSQSFVFLVLILSTLASYQVGVLVRQRILAHLEASKPLDTSGWLGWVVQVDIPPASVGALVSWTHCDGEQENALCRTCTESDSESDDDEEDSDEVTKMGQHLHGQQLSADVSAMKQDTLIPKLLELVSSQGWALKSHYCSNAEESSCVLLFHGGHQMLIHKPTRQVDIFSTDGDDPLLDWLNHMPLVNKWTFKERGANTNPTVFDAGLTDLYVDLLGSFQFTHKRLVAKEQSPFQEVAIYDTRDPRIHSPKKFQTDRRIYLDGVVQSRRLGERAYHEALVHPPMIMHPNPERVAIVGAGEGATLREVLKHSTVKEVIMIEIDSTVMEMSKKYLPEWNDCSDLVLPEGMINPTGNCFDDPRATVYAQDAIQWFMDRYPEDGNITEKLFDVIIMDALDPGDKVEFSDMLFDNVDLAATFFRALSPDGVFECQTGDEHHVGDPPPTWTRDRHAVVFSQNLGRVGFQRIFDYDEQSTRFQGLWSFLLASKSYEGDRWFKNAARIDLELRRRAMPTKSGDWPFHYYDGATHLSYLSFARPVVDVACSIAPTLSSCKRGPGLPQGTNIPAWEALTLQDGVVVAQHDLEPGTYVGLEECVHQTWDIPHDTKILIDAEAHAHIEVHMKSLKSFTFLFGTPAPIVGMRAKTVDMGNDAWMQDCRLADPTYERFEPGVENAMLERFWRIYDCAARRLVHKRVPAGYKVDCITPSAN